MSLACLFCHLPKKDMERLGMKKGYVLIGRKRDLVFSAFIHFMHLGYNG